MKLLNLAYIEKKDKFTYPVLGRLLKPGAETRRRAGVLLALRRIKDTRHTGW